MQVALATAREVGEEFRKLSLAVGFIGDQTGVLELRGRHSSALCTLKRAEHNTIKAVVTGDNGNVQYELSITSSRFSLSGPHQPRAFDLSAFGRQVVDALIRRSQEPVQPLPSIEQLTSCMDVLLRSAGNDIPYRAMLMEGRGLKLAREKNGYLATIEPSGGADVMMGERVRISKTRIEYFQQNSSIAFPDQGMAKKQLFEWLLKAR